MILMESAPENINPEEVRTAIASINGITNVHDVHVWQLTLNDNTATVHVVSSRPTDDVVRDVRSTLKEKFNIEHVTVQVESDQLHADGECGAC